MNIGFGIILLSAIIAIVCLNKRRKTQKCVNAFNSYLNNKQMSENDLEKIFIAECNSFVTDNHVAVAGHIVKGTIKPADTLTFINKKHKEQTVRVIKIEKFREVIEEGKAGDAVVLVLDSRVRINNSTYLFKKND